MVLWSKGLIKIMVAKNVIISLSKIEYTLLGSRSKFGRPMLAFRK